MSPNLILSFGLFLALSSVACGSDTSSSEGEIITNVQETNVSDPPPCSTTQTRDVVRQCDQREVTVYVCAGTICDAQLDELADAAESCDLDLGQTPYLPSASCDE